MWSDLMRKRSYFEKLERPGRVCRLEHYDCSVAGPPFEMDGLIGYVTV